MRRLLTVLIPIAALVLVTGCATKKPPVSQATTQVPAPAPFPGGSGGSTTPVTSNERPPAPPDVPRMDTVTSDPLSSKTPEEINSNSPLKPVFFAYDSDELDDVARATLTENAGVLKTYSTWVIAIEGHCDERGTAEYNLALGDRRALAARNYLLSLGVPAARIKTVSYGKEFPFDPGHAEANWKQNRRAQFMVTAKQ
ncbi:MAG TPA: OmpA family protein [Vicinamibacterales bacterium]|nr:OmpA family protein [Vicinamibacterales bacterium]